MRRDFRTQHRTSAPALLAMAMLAACAGGPVTSPTYQSPRSLELAQSALARGPMLVVVQGNPYPIADPAFVSSVLAAMRSAMTWTGTPRLTADPAAAPSPSLRVVMSFNAGVVDANIQCLGGSQGGGPAAGGAVQVTATFCGNGDLISNTSGHIDTSTGPDDPLFTSLMTQVTDDLFPQRPTPFPGIGVGVGGGFGVGSGGFSGGVVGVGVGL